MEYPDKYNGFLTLLEQHSELVPQVVEQVRKDFGSLLTDHPAGLHYNDIYNWVYPVMERLYKNDRMRFTSLMYTVDAGFMKKKFGQRTENDLVQWTHAVVLRECLKVFIRNSYQVNT